MPQRGKDLLHLGYGRGYEIFVHLEAANLTIWFNRRSKMNRGAGVRGIITKIEVYL